MNRFEQTLGGIDAFCRQYSLSYAVIGGIAAIVYQNPRTTQDIDITLSVELENIRATGEKLLSTFKALKQNPLDFFEQYFVLPVIYEPTKVRIDFAAGASGFERNAINRSKRLKFGQVEISVCTLEDLILFKLVASRYQDLADIEFLMEKYYPALDIQYLKNTAREFAELDRRDVLEKLAEFVNRFRQTNSECP